MVDVEVMSFLEGGMKMISEEYPPPHGKYLVERAGVLFTAVPCYGMHYPWWVVQTMVGEAEPVSFELTDRWIGLGAALFSLERVNV